MNTQKTAGGGKDDRRVDLHAHTTASDGSLTPTELVEAAKEAGLAAIAVTDHDTIEGVAEALEAGERLGVEVVPGVEVSAEHSPGQMHIVGLLIDSESESLATWLDEIMGGRDNRNPRIIAKLQELGIDITMEEVEAIAGEGAVGRPHIAQVLVAEGAVATTQEAFDRFLAKGAVAYFDRLRATPEDAIAQIHAAGGLAILAHANYCGAESPEELEALVRSLKDMGLDGIETQYSTFTEEDAALCAELAERIDLLPSGGTDFHGTTKPTIRLGVGTGDIDVPYETLARLKTAANTQN